MDIVILKNFTETVSETKINKNKKIEKIKQFLLNYNFNEIFTSSLISETRRLDKSSDKNPLNYDLALLRDSLVPNLIDIYPKNLRLGIDYLKFFEIGRIYKQENQNIQEQVLTFSFPVQLNGLNSKLSFFKKKKLC